ncbi:hypothetical protein LCGC14_2978460, partial [marine sediment metagenome]
MMEVTNKPIQMCDAILHPGVAYLVTRMYHQPGTGRYTKGKDIIHILSNNLCHRILIHLGKFLMNIKGPDAKNNDVVLATPIETGWIDACIKYGRFIPYDNVTGNQVHKFMKDDYIVLLSDDYSSEDSCFPLNYVYKQR